MTNLETLILLLISLGAGFALFPGLFVIQHVLHLPVPDLEKVDFHLHHSVLGIILILIGLVLSIINQPTKAVIVGGVGLGILLHHEHSEPHLKGIEKFIYWKRRQS